MRSKFGVSSEATARQQKGDTDPLKTRWTLLRVARCRHDNNNALASFCVRKKMFMSFNISHIPSRICIYLFARNALHVMAQICGSARFFPRHFFGFGGPFWMARAFMIRIYSCLCASLRPSKRAKQIYILRRIPRNVSDFDMIPFVSSSHK